MPPVAPFVPTNESIANRTNCPSNNACVRTASRPRFNHTTRRTRATRRRRRWHDAVLPAKPTRTRAHSNYYNFFIRTDQLKRASARVHAHRHTSTMRVRQVGDVCDGFSVRLCVRCSDSPVVSEWLQIVRADKANGIETLLLCVLDLCIDMEPASCLCEWGLSRVSCRSKM